MANPAPGWATKPEHRVDIHPDSTHLRVSFGGQIVADSSATLRDRGNRARPGALFPREGRARRSAQEDRAFDLLPVQGPRLVLDDRGRRQAAENAIWGYQTPYDETVKLRRLTTSFYGNRASDFDTENA